MAKAPTRRPTLRSGSKLPARNELGQFVSNAPPKRRASARPSPVALAYRDQNREVQVRMAPSQRAVDRSFERVADGLVTVAGVYAVFKGLSMLVEAANRPARLAST